MKTVLTIAGSDCSGGAGIQADLKTIAAHKLYGMSAITSLTAQNTTGVYGIYDVSPEFLKNQLDCIFTDIFPDAVKIGMVSNSGLIQVIADTLKQYRPGRVVLDPVMVSTSGSRLIAPEAQETLVTQLMPLASVITPNIPEAEEILKAVDGSVENKRTVSSVQITDQTMMEKAAQEIRQKYGCNVLLKGGHMIQAADDLLYQTQAVWFPAQRIDCTNTHGTGCTLSSAIASALARGYSLEEAVGIAKIYVRSAMSTGLDLGHGNGPLDHNWSISSAVLSQSDQSSR